MRDADPRVDKIINKLTEGGMILKHAAWFSHNETDSFKQWTILTFDVPKVVGVHPVMVPYIIPPEENDPPTWVRIKIEWEGVTAEDVHTVYIHKWNGILEKLGLPHQMVG